jgi:hypothetical protein
LKAGDCETDAIHDRLLLLDDHFGVVFNSAKVEVILNAESKTEH